MLTKPVSHRPSIKTGRTTPFSSVGEGRTEAGARGGAGLRRARRADGRPTLDAAKAEFDASWRKWLAWAKLGEMT